MSEPILTHLFPNGLVLAAEPMPWLESTAFSIHVPVGTAHDPSDRGGLSSFLCEMALRGAGSRDSRRFILDLDRLGVDHSESVSDAHTSYGGSMLAENLRPALSLFSDVLLRPHLPDDLLEQGRQVMLQELRAVEDEPTHKVRTAIRRCHYPAPWGRPSQGELAAVEAITAEEIREHFQRCYRPNGTILGVAGRFDWRELLEHVEQCLGDWKRGEEPVIVETPPEGTYHHIDDATQQTHIAISYPSVPYSHPDYFQAWGGVGILSGGMSSRLFTEVRERRGLCYGIHAGIHTLRHLAGVFCHVGTQAERARETFDVTLAELVRLGEGVGEDELQRLKARIKSSLIMQQESSASRSGAIARDWYHLDRVRPLDELGQLVDSLTAQSINAYLAEHPPTDFRVVTLGPEPLEIG